MQIKAAEWTLGLNNGIIIMYFMNKKALSEEIEIYFPMLFNVDPPPHPLPTELTSHISRKR